MKNKILDLQIDNYPREEKITGVLIVLEEASTTFLFDWLNQTD